MVFLNRCCRVEVSLCGPISINKLMDELATVALANYDARVCFEIRAAHGSLKRVLALLDRLDRAG
jgi:hypothetical protein